MKWSLTGTLVLLAGAFAVHAQGTVYVGNYLAANVYIYVGYKPATGNPQWLGGSSSGPPPTLSNYADLTGNGLDWSVEVYAAAGSDDPSSSLAPLGSIVTFANGVNDSLPGTWLSSGPRAVPGTTPGQVATVQLYAWYNDGGAITSYSQAQADGVPWGSSNPANMITTAGFVPPFSQPTVFGNFFVSVVPEPGTMALGVLGAFALLVRQRGRDAKFSLK